MKAKWMGLTIGIAGLLVFLALAWAIHDPEGPVCRLDRGVAITRVARAANGFSITARDGKKQTAGQITLAFSDAVGRAQRGGAASRRIRWRRAKRLFRMPGWSLTELTSAPAWLV